MPKGGEKPPSRYKKRKKEGDEKQLMHSGPDTVMNQIKQVRMIVEAFGTRDSKITTEDLNTLVRILQY